MLPNYFATAFHHLLKNKLFSAINIMGLAVGLAAFILLALHVHDEYSYDRHWNDSDRLYRLLREAAFVNSHSPPSALAALRQYFPDAIDAGARVMSRGQGIVIGDRSFPGEVRLADRSLIDLFHFRVVSGSLESTFSGSGNIALREDSALRYFGSSDPIGETLSLRIPGLGLVDYRVGAVYRMSEGNTILELPNVALLDESAFGEYAQVMQGLNSPGQTATTMLFIRLQQGADAKQINERLPAFVDQYAAEQRGNPREGEKPSDRVRYQLQKLSNAYFDPAIMERGGNKTAVLAFAAIAILVLLVASINFVTLTTSRATLRAREVATRKALGAKKNQLMIQFLGESMLVSALALVLALGLAEFLLPAFEALIGKELRIPYSSPAAYPLLIALLVVPGLLGGLYPALVLARFRPSRVLKANKSTETSGSIRMRNLLVIFQFAVSIALIVATAIVHGQLLHSRNLDTGFNPRNMLAIGLFHADARPRIDLLIDQIGGLPGVDSVALSARQPNSLSGTTMKPGLRNPEDTGAMLPTLMMPVDYGFTGTYEIPILAGRFFEEARDQPVSFSSMFISEEVRRLGRTEKVVINLSASRQFGFPTPEAALGKIIQRNIGSDAAPAYANYEIIGVAGDTQFRSLRERREAEVYILMPERTYFLTLRFQGDAQEMLTEIRNLWNNVTGDLPFDGNFIEETLAQEFAREEQEGRILITFSMLSIVITCLGLYGVASFTVERRVKEMSLRKVMGARTGNIAALLAWQFFRPVLLATLLAWPAALWSMQYWLQRFPYQLDSWLFIPICLGAGLTSLVIAGFAVAGNTRKVARRSPLHALRYE